MTTVAFDRVQHLVLVPLSVGDANDPAGFVGILGPAFFEEHVVTTDPGALTLTVQPRDRWQPDGSGTGRRSTSPACGSFSDALRQSCNGFTSGMHLKGR